MVKTRQECLDRKCFYGYAETCNAPAREMCDIYISNKENADKSERFWLVYKHGGNIPTRQHASQKEAEQEAVRLAKKHPGETFFVLCNILKCRADVPEATTTMIK